MTASSRHGLFISVEGGDGAGKTTQLGLLRDWLSGPGSPLRYPPVFTREPGGTQLGAAVRETLLHSEHVDPRAEALLYAGDRAHHVATVVRPALERGEVVITDRYLDSSIAYQGSRGELSPTDIEEISLWATQGLLPDITVLLDISAADARARRLAGRGETEDRIEAAGDDFHESVRQVFRERAAAEPHRWRVIDASRSVEEVFSALKLVFTTEIEKWAERP
ncbi:dTMP kinase [Dermabacteraceae bacterium P13138]